MYYPRKRCSTPDCPNASMVQGMCRRHYRAAQEGTTGEKRLSKMPPRSNRDTSIIPCACGCGGTLEATDGMGRPHSFLHGHNGSGRGKPSPLKGRPLTPEHSGKIAKTRTGQPHPYELTEAGRAARSSPWPPERLHAMRQCWEAYWSTHDHPNKSNEAHKSNMRAKRLHEVFPKKDSSIERALQDSLRTLGMAFETHKPITGQPDIFIAPSLCIFADGDYWHSLPKVQARDVVVNASLQAQGYRILRLAEHDIRKRLPWCLAIILAAV